MFSYLDHFADILLRVVSVDCEKENNRVITDDVPRVICEKSQKPIFSAGWEDNLQSLNFLIQLIAVILIPCPNVVFVQLDYVCTGAPNEGLKMQLLLKQKM